jgi:hypothetical protein
MIQCHAFSIRIDVSSTQSRISWGNECPRAERDEPTSCCGPRSRARRRKETKIFPPKGGGNITAMAKAYGSPITEIAKYTFNTGENKFATQFTKSRERVAGYVQRS